MSYNYQWGGMPPEHASATEVAEGTGMGVSGPGFFGDIANNPTNIKGVIQNEAQQGIQTGIKKLVGMAL